MRGFAQFVWLILSLFLLYAAPPVGVIMLIILAFSSKGSARGGADRAEGSSGGFWDGGDSGGDDGD